MEGERIIEPLLYIDQPSLNKPKAYMQDHYKTEKHIHDSNIKKGTDNEYEINRDKEESFNYLTIEEKIAYLVNLPSEVPSIKCEIITNEKKFRGILIEQNKEEVVLRIFGRENKTIKIAEITAINMIGF